MGSDRAAVDGGAPGGAAPDRGAPDGAAPDGAARTALAETESRLRATLAALPDLIFCHGPDGEIRAVHVPAGGEELLAPGACPGARVWSVLPRAVAERWMAAAARVLATGEPTTLEYELDLPAGHRHFEARMVMRGPDEVLSLVRDITPRVRDREARERASELFEAAWDQSPAVIVVTEPPDGRVRFVNAVGLAALGLPAEEVIGRRLESLMCVLTLRDANGDPFAAEDYPALAALRGETVRARTVRAVLADGREHWGIANAAPVRDRSGRVVAGVSVTQDITEQKRLERELTEVARQERERLARDLHDGLGQQLTGAALMAKALERRLEAGGGESGGEEAAAMAREIAEMVSAAHQEARFVAKGLSSIPVEVGMGSALRDLADNAAELYRVRVTVDARESDPVTDAGAASHLYQICREAVTNAVRHGRATRIEVSFEADPAGIRLVVGDDGCGILPSGRRAEGVGIRSMRFRAEQLGGSLTLERGAAGGTVVRVSAPRARSSPR